MKKLAKKTILLGFIALGIIVSISLYVLNQDNNNVNNYTTSDSQQIACIKEYKPVCGEVDVQCIKEPCEPVEQTFGNKCLLEQSRANFLYEGKCKEEERQLQLISEKIVVSPKDGEKYGRADAVSISGRLFLTFVEIEKKSFQLVELLNSSSNTDTFRFYLFFKHFSRSLII